MNDLEMIKSIPSVVGVEDRSSDGMKRMRVTFANGYGISVIRGVYSYGGPEGLYEIAVLKDDSITYDTEITNDVIGHLGSSEVHQYAQQIAAL